MGISIPVMCCLCVLLSVTVSAKDKRLTSVADLRYGKALYHYYLGEQHQALSELLVAEKKGGIKGHGDNPDIMAGGFYLGYGMERTASDIFERLLDENRPQKTRDAAWFYMARLRYLRGDWQGASEAVERVGKNPEPALAENMQALKINLQLRQDQPDAARDLFNHTLENSTWAPYLHYNLGAAYSRKGEYERAIKYFNKLLDLDQRGSEYLALYDKAMTAAGYTYLFSKDYDRAIYQFSKVRLNSPLSNKALLGYGWAHAEQEDYLAALKPWVALSKRNFIDESTQESYVAVPYAYEKLAKPSLALKYFREAEANFEAEIATLEEVISQLQGDALLDALRIDLSDDVNWLNYAENNNLTPQLTYLIELFAREDFQGLIQELRDLMTLQENLTQWQVTMTFYWDMLDEREFNRSVEMQSLKTRKEEQQLYALAGRRAYFDSEVKRIRTEDDFFALLSGKEAQAAKAIARSEKNIAVLQEAGEDVVEAREKFRRLRGERLWAAQEAYSQNLWNMRKNIKLLDKNIAQLQTVEQRVDKIINNGFDLQPYRLRIQEVQSRLRTQLLQLDETVEGSKTILRGQVAGVLQKQHDRLHHYLAQSRLSIARILDVGSEEQF